MERSRFAYGLRQKGLSFRNVGAELGVSGTRAAQLVRRWERHINSTKTEAQKRQEEFEKRAKAARLLKMREKMRLRDMATEMELEWWQVLDMVGEAVKTIEKHTDEYFPWMRSKGQIVPPPNE